jgi:tRNA(adenine34) deaminase
LAHNINMTDEEYMLEALLEAQKAYNEGEVPVGAIVVYQDHIIGRGHNRRESLLDVSSHAEIEALKDASKHLGRWVNEECSLYVTLEPCLMCAGAISQARIKRLVYGANDPNMGAIASNFFIYSDPHIAFRPLVSKGVKEKECLALLNRFFKEHRVKR